MKTGEMLELFKGWNIQLKENEKEGLSQDIKHMEELRKSTDYDLQQHLDENLLIINALVKTVDFLVAQNMEMSERVSVMQGTVEWLKNKVDHNH